MFADLWNRFTEQTPAPDEPLILSTLVLALLAVGYRPLWMVLRNVITIVHEGGHALAALLTGRRLHGIRLHSDTSGVTIAAGKPTGFGAVLTSASGYVAPSILGLGYAALLSSGRVTALLWLSIGLLALILIVVRNLYGYIAVAVAGGTLFAVSWYGSPDVVGAFAYVLTWFLYVGGVRPVFELQGKRGRGRAPDSDADQLARLTGIPGLLWVGGFLIVAIGALCLGGWWLLGAGMSDWLSLR